MAILIGTALFVVFGMVVPAVVIVVCSCSMHRSNKTVQRRMGR